MCPKRLVMSPFLLLTILCLAVRQQTAAGASPLCFLCSRTQQLLKGFSVLKTPLLLLTVLK